MGYFKKVKGDYVATSKDGEMNTPKETIEDVLKYPFKGYRERGIRKDTLEKFGVRSSVSEQDGKTPTAFYFPSYNSKGEVTGFMKQDLTKRKDEDFHWTAVGKVGIGNKLFGQDVAETINRKHTNFTVTEGQWDCLSVYQAQLGSLEGTKYEGQEPFVVSIPLGTKNATEALLHNKEFVQSFDSMTIFFDDDYATPAELKKGVLKGKEAREEVSGAFIGSIELFSIQPLHGYKDASDYLQDHKGVFKDLAEASNSLAKLVQFERKPLVTEKILHVSDISLEDVMRPLELGVQVDCFPKLNEMLGGFRKRELTIISASSGAGKTTAVSKICDDIRDQGYKAGTIYLEETATKTLQRSIAAELKVSYREYKRNPLAVASQEDITRVYNDLCKRDNIIFLDHFGSMPIKELMAKVKHMYFIEKCDYIVLDHLSMVISGSDVKDERKEIDIVMTELAAFCAANDIGIILVVHLNRQGSSVSPPKGKENEPFWNSISLSHLRGSGGLEQLSWNVLSLEREYLPNKKRGRVRWGILKNREFGDLGIADVFSLNDVDWSIQLYDDETTEVANTASLKKSVVVVDDDEDEIPF